MRRKQSLSKSSAAESQQKVVRCAIYTRKSSEEGLEQDFNSLDAQRESGENYIAAQKHEGWVALPDRYDDGGYTGGNMERPALAKLLADINAGKVDCVVVYKVDRLSRSLLDFARIMETFDRRRVSFVSVTQQFNTTHSMGRLTLNILLSFAQFEREIISERTRDKIAAARRKGKWSGGKPILGYDLVAMPGGTKLIVNDLEAERVRQIFEQYLENESLVETLKTLDERGCRSKQWVTRKGATCGGRPFDKYSLYRLLTNVVYVGKVAYHEEIHPGEHSAIVDDQTWDRVQAILQRNSRTGGVQVRNKHGALLKGMVRCVSCECMMTHSFSAKGTKRYRYYTCLHAMKRGWHVCPSKSIPAGEIEQFVVERIKCIGRDPAVLSNTISEVHEQCNDEKVRLETELGHLVKELSQRHGECRRLAGAVADASTAGKLAWLNERISELETQKTELQQQIVATNQKRVNEDEVIAALASFEPIWKALTPREQERMIRLLVERVDYDGERGKLSITFRPSGIRELARERRQEMAA